MGRVLAIDYGLKRVGLAVTDSLKMFAQPLCYVSNKELIPFLKDYIQKEDVEIIVIGYPLGLDGTSTHATKPVELFIKTLNKTFPSVPVVKEDERFTSKMAVEAMVEGGMKKKKRREKGIIDKISAALILQSYLESL